MTTEEAKFILSAVGPVDLQYPTPEVAAALRVVEVDSALGDWFEASREFDAAVSERLRDILPPPKLQATLAAGMQVSRRPAWRKRPIVFTLAAALAVAAGWWTFDVVLPEAAPPPVVDDTESEGTGEVAQYREDLLRAIGNIEQLDHVSHDPESVTAWLSERGVASDFDVPVRVQERSLAGCKVLEWRGHRISLICFDDPDDPSSPGLHLAVIDARAVPGLSEGKARSKSGSDWSTSAWRHGERVYLVAVRGEHPDARRLLITG